MEKKQYHHGDLKKELIENGICIIRTDGVGSLTMRSVAARCNVSPTAAYKHFKNKEELLEEISVKISEDFENYLSQCLEGNDGPTGMIEIGKGYVRYMLAHKEYYQFMFCSEMNIEVTYDKGEFTFPENSPFRVFYNSAEAFLSTFVKDKVVRRNKILLMWSEVHGLAGLLCNQVLQTSEDIDRLVEGMFMSMRA